MIQNPIASNTPGSAAGARKRKPKKPRDDRGHGYLNLAQINAHCEVWLRKKGLSSEQFQYGRSNPFLWRAEE